MVIGSQTSKYKSTHSLTDRTVVCGTTNPGSIPGGCTTETRLGLQETLKMMMNQKKLFAVLRLVMGFIFLWAGVDKIFGLGFATAPEKAWLAGVSPTSGFLANATEGPFAPFFQTMAHNPVIDFLFVAGLVLVGCALLLGIGMTIAGYSGSLMMVLIYASMYPPENNPFFDEHVVYIISLLILVQVKAGRSWGYGAWWEKQSIVQKYPALL